MIARRLCSLEMQMGHALVRMDAGGAGPSAETLAAWLRVLTDARQIAAQMDMATIGMPPPPKVDCRPPRVPGRPRLVVYQGGVQ